MSLAATSERTLRLRGARLIPLLACVWLWLAAAGCSKHDPGGDDDEVEDAGAGRGGSGAGGRSGTGGRPAPATVRCGTEVCAAPANILAALPIPTGIPSPVACCADSATAQCGSAALAGATCEPPAEPDPRCPGVDLGALASFGGDMGMDPEVESMTGCCTPDNQCGLDGSLFGRGCVENDEARRTLGAIPLVGGLIAVPAARACDAAPSGDDAGVADDDAGA